MNILISIIVPVYNTEQYLSVCLDSIINQTYKNFEIILVDDGSIDNSFNICMNYKNNDSRIIVIKNNHKGLVEARKLGVERANGEYCIFVDSDDWIADNLLEEVIQLTGNGYIDIVNYGFSYVKGNTKIDQKNTVPNGMYKFQQLEKIYKKMMFDFEKGCPGIIQSLCTKLIRRNILSHSIKTVDNRITMGEDAAVTYKALLNSNKIVVTNKCYYFYRFREGSMTTSRDVEVFNRIYYFQKYMLMIFSQYDNKLNLEKQLQAYLIHFINKGINDIYSIRVKKIYRMPVYILENIGTKIVLYGAGNVGKSYYRQLLNYKNIEIVAWIDKNYKDMLYGLKIKMPDILKYIDYDTILIAIKNENTAVKIRKELSEFVPNKKIVWGEPFADWREMEIEIEEC